MRATVVISAVLTVLAAAPALLAGPVDPAQAIAQKFLEADQAPPQPRAKPKPPRVAKELPMPCWQPVWRLPVNKAQSGFCWKSAQGIRGHRPFMQPRGFNPWRGAKPITPPRIPVPHEKMR